MAVGAAESLTFILSSPDFVELHEGQDFHIDLRYASGDNFVGFDMYGPFRRAFLHRDAAAQLAEAVHALKRIDSRYRFVIFDALRPRSIQRILWSHVVGTENQQYIADPDKGSLHNFGFAVDLSILDENGEEFDMGAGFDDFRPVAQPQLEAKHLAEGLISAKQIDNRLILRESMQSAGFRQLPHEWWHFDARDRETVRAQYKLVE